MDEQSGETEEKGVIGEGIGESEMKKLVPEWGWQRDKGSWRVKVFAPIFMVYRAARSPSSSLILSLSILHFWLTPFPY